MTDNTRRHWHGTPGDRHEHHNVWMQGGPKGPTGRAAWAMLPGMEDTKRRSSAASATSTGSNNAANTENNTVPSVSERRRSSTTSSGSPGLFSNLQSQKRTSADPSMAARRASWNEQAQQGGFFSKWWSGYTRGS